MSTIIEFKSGLSSVDCVYRTVKASLSDQSRIKLYELQYSDKFPMAFQFLPKCKFSPIMVTLHETQISNITSLEHANLNHILINYDSKVTKKWSILQLWSLSTKTLPILNPRVVYYIIERL